MKTNSRMMVLLMTMVSANTVYGQTDLLPNGDFNDSQGIAGWTGTPYSETLAYGIAFYPALDADNAGGSGSLELVGVGSTANSTCFPVVPGAAFSFGGKLSKSAVEFGTFGESQLLCKTYMDGGCASSNTVLGALRGGTAELNNGFSEEGPITGTLGSNDRFVQCSVSNIGYEDTNAQTAFAFVDDLYFNSRAPTFPLLGGYLSGSWYDPTQSGQGFQLEFTAQANTLLATWYTYSPDGSGTTQWVYGQGNYDPTQSSVTIPTVLTSGAAFPPNFVAANVNKTPWGNLTFTFTDCNHATMSWSSTLPGYGSGTQHLSRLTSIAGLSCPQ
jgi:hypothetical protein